MFRPRTSRSLSYLLPRLTDVIEQICSHQGFLSDLFGSQIACETVQINGKQYTLCKRPQILLRENAREHSCQNIPDTTSCHPRVARGIDEDLTIRHSHNRPEAFEHNIELLSDGKVTSY